MGRKEAASTRALNFFFLPRRSYWLGRSGHGCQSGAPERQTPTSLQARATTRPSDGPNWAREVHSRRLQGFFLLLGDEMTYIWLITTVFTLLEFAIDGYFKSINDSLRKLENASVTTQNRQHLFGCNPHPPGCLKRHQLADRLTGTGSSAVGCHHDDQTNKRRLGGAEWLHSIFILEPMLTIHTVLYFMPL